MLEFRRGREHIVKANEQGKSGGDRRPFLATLYWSKDQDTKYLWILNPVDTIPMVLAQKVWTDEGRPEYVIARTEPRIGDLSDPMEDQWGYNPQDLNVCIAAELEPTFELIRGRQRPTGFEVKTRTFQRKIRNAKGEATDEREEVTAPIVGVVMQSPNNFFNHVSSGDANVAPIESSAIRVTRIGEDKSTEYEVEVFEDKPLDMTNLTEFMYEISYLTTEEKTALATDCADLDEQDTAIELGSILLDKRLNEMADEAHYQVVLASISQVARYPSKKYREKGAKAEESAKAARPARPSQRRSQEPEVEETGTPEEAVPETPTPRRSRATKSSPVRERMAELRQKSEAKAEKAA